MGLVKTSDQDVAMDSDSSCSFNSDSNPVVVESDE
jgi:hypothetical protein